MRFKSAPRAAMASTFQANFLAATVAAGMILGALFLAFPGIDLKVAHATQTVCSSGSGAADWCSGRFLKPARNLFIVFSVVTMLVAAFGLWRGQTSRSVLFGMPAVGRAGWLFMLVNFAVGVGLVANVVFKDQWGRARPHQTIEFGGSKHFTPALVPSDQCLKNCSFVSGEAAAVFGPFFGAAVLMPQYGVPLAAAGVVAGGASGAVRMLSGRHFLSDVVFAGVFMALTALGLHALFFGRLTGRTVETVQGDLAFHPYSVFVWWLEQHPPATDVSGGPSL